MITNCRPSNTKMAGCVNQRDDHEEQSPKSRPGPFPVMFPPCRICREKASGFHYGANTCESCKVYMDKE